MFKKLKPEHYDLLGVFVFPAIFSYALYLLVTNANPPRITSILLLLTGVIGTFIDGSIVYEFFIKKHKK